MISADAQTLDAVVTTAGARRPNELDLVSPRSTAALALSSLFAAQVVERQHPHQPPTTTTTMRPHHLNSPAILFANDTDYNDDDEDETTSSNNNNETNGSNNKTTGVSSTTDRKSVSAPPTVPTVEQSKEADHALSMKPSSTQKTEAATTYNTIKAGTKKRGENSMSSSMPRPYSAQPHHPYHNHHVHHQHPQYAMVPVQFLHTYAVHHPDFYPPGANPVPWTPHSGGNDGHTIAYSPRGLSPPSMHNHHHPPHRPSPPIPPNVATSKPRPSTTLESAVRKPDPSPPSGILRHRPSPPLRASPPAFGMTPHQHHHHPHLHHARCSVVPWQYPPVSGMEHVL